MKIFSDKGVLHAIAETITDTRTLLTYATDSPTKEVTRKNGKTCTICGKKFPSKIGWGIHRYKTHNIKGKQNRGPVASSTRNLEIQAMRANGASISHIAQMYDISGPRVFQILKQMKPEKHSPLLDEDVYTADEKVL